MSLLRQGVNLVVVDDDPSMVRLITKLLAGAFDSHLHIESFTDAESARTRIDEGGVDILLTDLEMPGSDGLDLLRDAKLRKVDTQVVLLTGHSTLESLMQALELGAVDYLLKPVDHQQLIDLIRESVRRQLRWKQALAQTWQIERQRLPMKADPAATRIQ